VSVTTELGVEEQRVTDLLARRRGTLLDLAASLIAFNTTASTRDDVGGDERALQGLLAQRLGRSGFAVDLFAPRVGDLPPSPMIPPELDLSARPQLIARLGGVGGGRDLLLNGHVDVVSAEPRTAWSSDPFVPHIRDGRLFGRGACDMKGGVAAMVLAAEALAELEIPLLGDLIVNTVTDEESTGAGALACIARGLRADGCLVPEPTSGEIWLGARGVLLAELEVEGVAGHTGLARGDALAGGGVGAIEPVSGLLSALRELREEWWRAAAPGESPGWIVPTHIAAGEWIVTYPERCRVALHVTFSPEQADAGGWGSAVRREVEERVRAAARADPWLRLRPPVLRWSTEVPAAKVEADAPIVTTALESAQALRRPAAIAARTTWLDTSSFIRAGTPAIGLGPGDIEVAHTVDEWVEVDDLVRAAQLMAVCAMRFCGVDA
jgi:acetylornithine deacetylase